MVVNVVQTGQILIYFKGKQDLKYKRERRNKDNTNILVGLTGKTELPFTEMGKTMGRTGIGKNSRS